MISQLTREIPNFLTRLLSFLFQQSVEEIQGIRDLADAPELRKTFSVAPKKLSSNPKKLEGMTLSREEGIENVTLEEEGVEEDEEDGDEGEEEERMEIVEMRLYKSNLSQCWIYHLFLTYETQLDSIWQFHSSFSSAFSVSSSKNTLLPAPGIVWHDWLRGCISLTCHNFSPHSITATSPTDSELPISFKILFYMLNKLKLPKSSQLKVDQLCHLLGNYHNVVQQQHGNNNTNSSLPGTEFEVEKFTDLVMKKTAVVSPSATTSPSLNSQACIWTPITHLINVIGELQISATVTETSRFLDLDNAFDSCLPCRVSPVYPPLSGESLILDTTDASTPLTNSKKRRSLIKENGAAKKRISLLLPSSEILQETS